MFGKKYRLFTMFGFRVSVDWSWLIIAVLITWTLAEDVFRQNEGLTAPVRWVLGVAGSIGLFASVVFHELCHSLVARRYGLPMKGITLFIFGGVAEMSDEPPSPKAEFLMAIAGPAASLAASGFFFGINLLENILGLPLPASLVFHWLGLINLLLVVFNMIPGFPLDGGRVLRSALWGWKKDLRWATRIASQVGLTFGFLLIGLGVFYIVFIPGGFVNGLWWFLIGLFIRYAAKQGYQQVIIRQVLQGEPVRRIMNPQPVTVDASISLNDLVEDYIYKYHFKSFPVVQEGRLAGCVGIPEVSAVPRAQWPLRTVGEVLRPCSPEDTIGPDADAQTALTRMNAGHVGRLMVVEGDRLVGIMSLKDIMRVMSLKMELQGAMPGDGASHAGCPGKAGRIPDALPPIPKRR